MRKSYTNNNLVQGVLNRLFQAVTTLLLIVLLLTGGSLSAQITQQFNNSGTFSVPAGVTSLTVYIFGAGGGGGGGTTGSSWANGGGGGGGACTVNTITVGSNTSYTVTVGAAGAAGTPTANGGTGGTSTFVGNVTGSFNAGGGSGGAFSTGSAAGVFAGGAGGSTGTGTVFAGGSGSAGNDASGITGSGGGAGGSGAAGTSGSGTCSGSGGAGGTGSFAGGTGAYNANCSVTTDLAGTAGTVPGGGGSGNCSWTTSNNGGAGAKGRIFVVYTPPCTTPSVATSLSLTPGAGTVTGTFTAPGTAPTGYLVIRTTTASAPSAPVLGTTYTPGTSALGGTIVSTNTTTGFTDNGLGYTTQYWYWVYSYNSGCNTSNPVYSATNLNGNTTTLVCTQTNTMALTALGTYAWNTAANWSLGHVPLACENAVITGSSAINGTATINLSSSVTVNSLTITLTGAGNAANADIITFNTNAFALISTNDFTLTNTSTGAGAHAINFYITAGGSFSCNNFTSNINGTAGTNGNLISINGLGTLTVNGTMLAKAPATGGGGGQVQMNVGDLPASATFVGNAVFDDGTTSSVGSIYVGTTAITGNTTGSMIFKANASFGAKAFSIQGNIHGAMVFDAVSAQTLTVNNATTMYFPSMSIGSSNSPVVTLAGTGSPILDATAGTPLGLSINNSSTLDLATNTFNVSAAATSTLSLAAAATLKVGGTTGGAAGSNFPNNYSAYTFAAGSTVEYYGAAQTIFNTPVYDKLILSTSGIKTATAALSINSNFTINSPATFAAGTFTHNVGGNWSNAGTFTPSTSKIRFNGTGAQTISKTGGETFAGLIVNKASGSLTMLSNITVTAVLNLNNGLITTGLNTLTLGTAGSTSNAGTTSYVNGLMAKSIAGGIVNPTFTFPFGDATGYAPVTLTGTGTTGAAGSFGGATSAGDLTSPSGSGFDYTKSVNRNWTLGSNLSGITAYAATLNYPSAELDAGATSSKFVAKYTDGTSWFGTTVNGTPSSTAISITGIASLSATGYGFQVSELQTFNIVSSSGGNGTISPNGTTAVSFGASQTYTITPNACHSINKVLVDGVNNPAAVSSGTFTFTNVTATHTISASYNLNGPYTITVSAGANGGISPGTGSITCGANSTYTITPNSCYHVADVLVDGLSQGPVTSYTFTNVTATHTISATFAINTYSATVSAGANGSITPGSATVNCGSNNTYTISPNACYHITDVTLNGISQGAVGTINVNGVAANYTVAASFAINTYTITATAGPNGSITPATGSVNCGDNATYTITPNACYSIADVVVDGVSQGAVGTYTFTNVTAAHSISATFVLNTYTITVTAGANGSITPATGSVNCGDNATYTITANACYSIADVLVDGVSVGAVGTFTFTNVTAAHTISASFVLNTYTITVTAGANGSITPATGSVNCGDNATYTITPAACYSIADVLVDGVSVGAVGTYTFTNVTAAHTISASFVLNTYTITVTAGANGSITPATGSVNCGDNATYTITPAACSTISDVVVDGVSQGAVGTYTFTNITANHTISASFTLTLTTWYQDNDGDNYGNSGVTQMACTQPVGYVALAGDCDDTNAAVHPGATEICNGIDDDCDGLIDEVLPAGIVAYYPFNGNANDASGNGHNGTVSNAVLTADRNGVPNSAYSFNGTNTGINIPDHNDFHIASFTIGAWAQISSSLTTFVSKTYGNSFFNSYALGYDFGSSSFATTISDGGSSPLYYSAFPISNNWFHYTLSFDNATKELKFYGNGVILSTTTANLTLAYDNNMVTIGYEYNNGAPAYFTLGNIDDVIIFNRVLSSTEVSYIKQNSGSYVIPPVLNAGTVSGTSTLCISATATYSSNGDTGGVWTSTNTSVATVDINSGVVTAVAAGTTNITYTVSAPCATPVSSFQQLTVSPNYTITASAGANGSISPNGITTLCEGSNQSYTITANACYSIADVLVDGVSVGAVGTYTFTNVTAAHTISASFVLNTYTITVTAGANGSITPATGSVNCGDNATYTITANACYSIADVLVDGVSVGAVGTYTFTNVTAAHTISASFVLNTYTITVTAGANGSITPATGSVNCGDNATYTITANACYSIADVLVDGVSVGAVGTYTFTNVTAAHTISASFVLNTYTITVTAGANGSITPATGSVNCGDNATYTITANACYSIADVLVDGVSVGAVGTYTFTNVTAAHTISASFVLNTYTITVTAGANGSITPATGSVNCGDNATYTITANACYSIADVLVDGVSVGAVGTYTFTNVTAAHTISATFVLNTYTITVTAGANGSITPATGSVNCGDNATYTITANACYSIADVLVDGVSVGAVGTYTFTNVTAAHTISASFVLNTYTITVTAGANGSITPATGSVNCGDNATYTITANACYSIADVLVDGVSVGAVGTYTFTNVTAAHTISASFVLNTYTITVTAGANGSITPATGSVNCGDNATYTITANACYSIADVLVDGVSVGAVGTYTFTNVTANHTISATFVLNTYTITVTAGANGSITPATGSVNCGDNATYTITPNACYSIADVIVDGVSQGAVGTYTFTNVTANHTISATFVLNTYTITVTAGANGSITPATGSVNCGDNATYTITANACYSIANVIVDGVSQGAVGTFTFTNVTANHTISATFSLNTYAITVTAGANGTITPGTGSVNCGSNATYTITANACYHINDVVVDGVSQGAVGTYTFTNVTATHTISASFVANTPLTAPVVTGPVNVCPYIGTGTQLTYSVPVVPGATSYNWTVPTSVTIVSGQGTPNLVVTIGNTFQATPNKQIRISVATTCGTTPLTVYVLVAQAPGTPQSITGPTSVCPIIGTPATFTYTIPSVPNATSYIWAAQLGTTTITHPNGPGVNDTTVNVSFTNGVTSSSLTVRASNDSCGASNARSLALVKANPSQPGLIAGSTNACPYMAPGGIPATYSVVAVVGQTYNWTVPAGAIGLTGQGTNAISFTYPASFVSGTISVTTTNGCGTSAARTLSINKLLPATPGVIDVIQTQPCPNRIYTYTISATPASSTSVQWTVPAGATLVSGQGTNSITVSYPGTAFNSNVTAQSFNNCGSSTVRSTSVHLPACPEGKSTFTKGKAQTTTPSTETMKVNVYPNPTVSDFKLQVVTAGKQTINVRIVDAQGRNIKTFEVMPYQTINVGSELKAGAYMMEVRQGNEVKVTKLLKF